MLRRVTRGMRHAVAALAGQGNDVIVDDVLTDSGDAAEHRELLRFCEVRLVALVAPLEARERARGDRAIGLARGQFGRVHRGIGYDLEVDTTAAGPGECARAIRDAFGL